MFKSIYRVVEHPDRQLGEAVLNWKGVLLMLLVFFSEQFIPIFIQILLNILNARFGTDYGLAELNLFTQLATLSLMVLIFGQFFGVNLINFFREFKPVYVIAPVACYIGALAGQAVVMQLLTALTGSEGTSSNNEVVMQLLNKQPLGMFLMIVVLGPITEESVFRAAIFRPLSAKKNVFLKALGYLLSVFLFALMHVYQFAFFATDANGMMYLTFNAEEFLWILLYVPMAIGLAVCAHVCKNYWGSVLCHMLTNGVAASMMLLLMLMKDYLV